MGKVGRGKNITKEIARIKKERLRGELITIENIVARLKLRLPTFARVCFRCPAASAALDVGRVEPAPFRPHGPAGPMRLWPFQREIANALGDPEMEQITLVKSVLVGFTTVTTALIGHLP